MPEFTPTTPKAWERLASDISKTSAVDYRKISGPAPQENTVAQVHEYADPNYRIAAVARAYAEHPSNTVVIPKTQPGDGS